MRRVPQSSFSLRSATTRSRGAVFAGDGLALFLPFRLFSRPGTPCFRNCRSHFDTAAVDTPNTRPTIACGDPRIASWTTRSLNSAGKTRLCRCWLELFAVFAFRLIVSPVLPTAVGGYGSHVLADLVSRGRSR